MATGVGGYVTGMPSCEARAAAAAREARSVTPPSLHPTSLPLFYQGTALNMLASSPTGTKHTLHRPSLESQALLMPQEQSTSHTAPFWTAGHVGSLQYFLRVPAMSLHEFGVAQMQEDVHSSSSRQLCCAGGMGVGEVQRRGQGLVSAPNVSSSNAPASLRDVLKLQAQYWCHSSNGAPATSTM